MARFVPSRHDPLRVELVQILKRTRALETQLANTRKVLAAQMALMYDLGVPLSRIAAWSEMSRQRVQQIIAARRRELD